MSKPILERLFISDVIHDAPELRLDWSNDRHHSVPINPDMTVGDIAIALYNMADLIGNDEELHGN